MRKQGSWWLVAGAALVAVAVGLSAAYRRQRAGAEPRTSSGPAARSGRPATGVDALRRSQPAQAASQAGLPAPRSDNAPEQRAAPRPRAVPDSQIAVLTEFLDADDRGATLAQARKMVASSKVDVRAAALEALRWLGGREVVNELVAMLSDADPDIADAAAEGLVNVLDELDDPFLSASILEQAIQRVPSDGSAEALLLSLSGLPEEASVPVLLNLLEGQSARLSALAREYLEFVSGGQEISTRSQGEAWLREKVAADAAREMN